MVRFNETIVRTKAKPRLNREGGLAFQDDPLMALYRQVATSLWSGDGYYEKKEQWLKRFQANVAQALEIDINFPFALAAYARDRRELALRMSPIALYVESATNKAAKGTRLIRQYAPLVLRRADEPAEAIAYFRQYHQGVIPHGLLRGIADALPNFDEYQLSKYKGRTRSVTMRDVFRLARPKPVDEVQEALWNRVISDSLETPYTWETELSQCQTDEAKQQKWNELIGSGKLGLFALIRNIRNIIKYQADIEGALSQITPERVKGAGILPFQWYKAYKAILPYGEALAAPMQQAIEWSLADIPKLPGRTLVACDNSGSMSSVTATRGMDNAEIANLMGAMSLYCCEQGIAGTFGSEFAIAHTNSNQDLFTNKAAIDRCGQTTGHATDAWKIFQALIRERFMVDRVIIFSDMQCYDSQARAGFSYWGQASHSLSAELESYRQINPEVKVYSVNLASQDNTCQFAPEQSVIELAGWSESIFQFISAMEAGKSIIPYIKGKYGMGGGGWRYWAR